MMYSIDRTAAKEMVGPGWAGLLDVLYNAMPDGVVVSTVKEKFGCLRVYADGGPANFEQLIEDLEKLSALICKRCGKLGGRRSVGGWITTLCEDHHRDRVAAVGNLTYPSPAPPEAVLKATAPTAEAG